LFLLLPSPKVSSCTLASSSYFKRSKGPPPTPLLSPSKGKSKGKYKIEDLNNIRKENTAERVEAIDGQGIRVPNQNVPQLEQKLLKFQEGLD